ncbi:MAG: hypothetical protein KJO24_05700 [Gammaproteobacteria bacterium]|nr:hypothetical protein [Gammaproteobacteria bacterium]
MFIRTIRLTSNIFVGGFVHGLSRPGSRHRLQLIAMLLLLLAGCMGYDPISNEVRAGGTVFIAVDAVRHTLPDEEQAQAIFTDSAGVEHNVAVRYLLRVQPDPISDIGLGFVTTTKGFYAGQAVAIIDLVEPVSRAMHTSPAIAEGAGVLQIFMPDVALRSEHGLTILPQSSLPEPPLNNLRIITDVQRQQIYQQNWLDLGRALPHVLVKTTVQSDFDHSQAIAGVTLRMRARNYDFNTYSRAQPFGVTKLTSDPNLQLAWRYHYQPVNEFSELIITVSNPHGFAVDSSYSNRLLPKSSLTDLSSIAIGWFRRQYLGQSASPLQLIEPPVFIGIDGEPIDGIHVELLRQT